MKKLYLLLLMSFIALLGFGQIVKIEENVLQKGVELKSLNINSAALNLNHEGVVNISTSTINVLVAGAEDLVAQQDVAVKLMATGLFNSVDICSTKDSTPSLEFLLNYDAILYWTDYTPYSNADLGTVIKNYIDAGGGFVDGVFETGNYSPLAGDYTNDYKVVVAESYAYSGGIMVQKDIPTHELLINVDTFYNQQYVATTNTLQTGAYRIASYSDKWLIAAKENIGPKKARRVSLNFFPPSSDVNSGSWSSNTDGDIIMANALVWVARACIADITQDNDPGECGAVVTYTQPTAWDTATVTQIDGSGLSSGDLFPVDTTIQSYRIDYGGGDVDTCTFSVIVKDVEAPVALCKDITLELDSTGHASLSSGSRTIYFTGTFENKVWKYDGENVSELYNPAGPGSHGPVGIRYVPENGNLYWTTANNQHIMEAPADGSGIPVSIGESIGYDQDPLDLAVDYENNRFFFVTACCEPGDIFVGTLDGSAPITHLYDNSTGGGYAGIEYVSSIEKLYFGLVNNNIISCINADGTGYTELYSSVDGVNGPRDIAVDIQASKIYWTNGNNGTIMSANMDGTGSPVVIFTPVLINDGSISQRLYGLFLDDDTQMLYWTIFDRNGNPMSDCIYKAPADGSGIPELVVQGSFGGIRGIFVDGGGLAIDNGSTDACGITSIEASQTEFSYSDIGENTVTMTVTDVHGNVSTCTSIVTVTGDVLPPTVSCRPLKVYLDRSGAYNLSDEDINYIAKGTTDDVTAFEDLDIQVTPSAFSCDSVGEVSVLVTAMDEAGNIDSCETVVTVINNFEISPFPVSDITVELPEGVCETKVEYPYIGSFTPCVTFTQLEGLGPAGHFPAGATTEVWQAVNTSGDTMLISFTVTVVTVGTEPTLAAIGDVETDENTPVSVTLSGIGNGGGCDMDSVILTVSGYDNALFAEVTLNYSNGDTTGTIDFIPNANQFGTSGITVEVTDGEGLVTTQTFTVSVMPVNDAPVLVQPLPDVTLIAKDTVEIDISKQLGTMFDDIDDSTLTITIDFNGDTLLSWIAVSEDQDLYSLVVTPLQADTGCYSIIVTATDLAGAMVADTFELCVDKLVGIQNLSDQLFDISMYPNPTNAKVNIDMISTAGNVEVMVMNIAGAEVYRKVFKQSEAIRFDLSDNVSGMYLVRVKTGDKQVIKKLILDRK